MAAERIENFLVELRDMMPVDWGGQLPAAVVDHIPTIRVKFDNSDYSASIAICPCWDEGLLPEIALLGRNGKLVYLEELGYEDVCKFPNIGAVGEELRRLSRVLPPR